MHVCGVASSVLLRLRQLIKTMMILSTPRWRLSDAQQLQQRQEPEYAQIDHLLLAKLNQR